MPSALQAPYGKRLWGQLQSLEPIGWGSPNDGDFSAAVARRQCIGKHQTIRQILPYQGADGFIIPLAVLVVDRDKGVRFRIPIFVRLCDDLACAQVSHLRFPLPTGLG